MLIYSTTIDVVIINTVSLMQDFAVLTDEIETEVRLNEIGLEKSKLIEVVDAAFIARANATDHHPKNAGGMFSWLDGVRQMRDSFVGDKWQSSRHSSVDYIECPTDMVRIGFCNVVVAASIEHDPEPVSPRRNSAIESCYANCQQYGLPHMGEKKQNDPWKTYYLMVGEDGTAELSLPLKCESGKFYELVERIFLVTQDDLDSDFSFDDVSESSEPEIEIEIKRKT